MAQRIKDQFPNRIKSAHLAPEVYGKVPPQAPDLEQAVLGALMLEKGQMDLVMDILHSEDCFYVDANQKIFATLRKMFDKGMTIDLLTLNAELMKEGILEEIGGTYYLTQLTMNVVSSAHIEAHARIIQEKYIGRELIRFSGMVLKDAYEATTDVFDLLNVAENQLFELSTGNLQANYVTSAEAARQGLDRIQYLMENKGELTGVPTGYKALDNLFGGWQHSNLIILAARPSVGKTALMLNLAINAASDPHKPTGVAIFSLEMSTIELTNRILSSMAQVNIQHVQQGKLEPWEQDKINAAAARFAKLPVFIDDSPGMTLYNMRAKARRLVSKEGVGLIMLDYLQLMELGGEGKTGIRELEISTISRKLKALAKELNVPIIALSQMNRSVEGEKREPRLSDLRDSGAIEQDADIVGFLRRPDYQKKEEDIDPTFKGHAELLIRKSRHGEITDITFYTALEIQTWFNEAGYQAYKNPPAVNLADVGKKNAGKFITDFTIPQSEQGKIDDLPF